MPFWGHRRRRGKHSRKVRAAFGSGWFSLVRGVAACAGYQFRGSQHTPRRDTTRPNGINETIQQRAAAPIETAMHGKPQEVKLLLKSFQHPFGANKGQPLDVDGHRSFFMPLFVLVY